jgi:hypothetical protein
MTIPNRKLIRVLALDPSSAGFGFAVLEEPTRLVDWGVAEVWSKSPQAFLARVEPLVDRYAPSLIVVENIGNSKQRKRASQRITSVVRYAATRRIATARIPRSEVKKAFGGNPTKHDIAVEIADIFPELTPRLPAKRKLWESEREQMNLFDALSFALTAVAGMSTTTGT